MCSAPDHRSPSTWRETCDQEHCTFPIVYWSLVMQYGIITHGHLLGTKPLPQPAMAYFNGTLEHNLWLNFDKFTQENAFENAFCKMAATSSAYQAPHFHLRYHFHCHNRTTLFHIMATPHDMLSGVKYTPFQQSPTYCYFRWVSAIKM